MNLIEEPSQAPHGPRRMDGRRVADGVLVELEHRVSVLKDQGVTPTLGILLIGTDPRSETYVRMKRRAAERIGVRVRIAASFTSEESPWATSQVSPAAASEMIPATLAGIQSKILEWNADPTIHGAIVQLPLPDELWEHELEILETLDPAKDADGLHPFNMGRLLRGQPTVIPATPRGVMKLLDEYHVPLAGARVTQVGFGKLVGRALATLLIERGATLTVATSRAKDLSSITKSAEVIVSATGVGGLLTADMVAPNAVLVDVGLSEVDDRLVGDIAHEAHATARLATPVPGGVGPMTVAMLLTNVVEAAERTIAL